MKLINFMKNVKEVGWVEWYKQPKSFDILDQLEKDKEYKLNLKYEG